MTTAITSNPDWPFDAPVGGPYVHPLSQGRPMTAHTPMTSNGSIVFLPGDVCFSVLGLPDSTGLAALIATACTHHQQLVDELASAIELIEVLRKNCVDRVTVDESAMVRMRSALPATGAPA